MKNENDFPIPPVPLLGGRWSDSIRQYEPMCIPPEWFFREKPKPPVCYKCGKPATRFCDFRDCGANTYTDDYGRPHRVEWASIETCDRPMCDECAHHYGEDTDFCDEHDNELSRFRTAKAERIYEERLKRLGIEGEKEGEKE